MEDDLLKHATATCIKIMIVLAVFLVVTEFLTWLATSTKVTE